MTTTVEKIDMAKPLEQSSFASFLMLSGLWLIGITIVAFGWPFLIITAISRSKEKRDRASAANK